MEESKDTYLNSWLALSSAPKNTAKFKKKGEPGRPENSHRFYFNDRYFTGREAECFYLVLIGVKMSEISNSLGIKIDSIVVRMGEVKRRYGFKKISDFIDMLKENNFVKKYMQHNDVKEYING